MTIKKRLTLSNIIMIASLIGAAVIFGVACLITVYFTLHGGSGIAFKESADFRRTVSAASGDMYELFEHGDKSVLSRVSWVGNIINGNSMFMRVYENGNEFYTAGNAELGDSTLEESARRFGSNSFVSNDKIELYYYCDSSNGTDFEMFIYNTEGQKTDAAVKRVLILSTVIIAIAVILTVFITNRLLNNFVFSKIARPLDMLSHGVNEISNGNLNYRLHYNENDEFRPVCESFNEMAIRLKRSVELAQRNEESRKELLLDISHDLRTPLTAIQAYVEGLIDGVAATPEMQKRYLETVKRKTNDIEKMVSALFAYSKLDMEEFETDVKDINIDMLLENTVKRCVDEYHERGLDINIRTSNGLTVVADSGLLERVFQNLLENSCKYKNKEVGTVDIYCREKNLTAEIVFADDGPGVDESQLTKIFDVFYRTDKARSNTGNGSGIGLAFAKKAVEEMHGSIYAEKSASGGLAIIIELPKKAD